MPTTPALASGVDDDNAATSQMADKQTTSGEYNK